MPNELQPGDLVEYNPPSRKSANLFYQKFYDNTGIGLVVGVDPNWTYVYWSDLAETERLSFSVLKKVS